MPKIKYPLQNYDVRGSLMSNDGAYTHCTLYLKFDHLSQENLAKLDEFLRSQGWLG